jgi:hypothetical protein
MVLPDDPADLCSSGLPFSARRFEADRQRLCAEFAFDLGWWGRQPRCTAKTGWIIQSAAATVERRAVLQVAACQLGMLIAEVVPGTVPDA